MRVRQLRKPLVRHVHQGRARPLHSVPPDAPFHGRRQASAAWRGSCWDGRPSVRGMRQRLYCQGGPAVAPKNMQV